MLESVDDVGIITGRGVADQNEVNHREMIRSCKVNQLKYTRANSTPKIAKILIIFLTKFNNFILNLDEKSRNIHPSKL